jgi:hypothetical protein
MPFLHFNGNFKFQVPLYNNVPQNRVPEADLKYDRGSVGFNEDISRNDLHELLRSDPLKYFEFEFSDVHVKRITYDDASLTEDQEEEPVMNKQIMLKGILVDVAPHLNVGQLFAGEFRVEDVMLGKLKKAIQSEVYFNIRSENVEQHLKPWFLYAAHFETQLNEVYRTLNLETSKRSRYIKELGRNGLKIYFHTSRYDITKNQGNVYGYIGRNLPETDKRGARIKSRRLVSSPDLSKDVADDFKIEAERKVEGSYDVLKKERLLVLRYLDFIPFIDNDYHTPEGYKFFVEFFNKNYDDPIINNQLKELVGNHNEMVKSGGTQVFQLPKKITDPTNVKIKINLKKNNGDIQLLMVEPNWDAVLEDERQCITMRSNSTEKVSAKIYYENKLNKKPILVYLETQIYDKENESPIVAEFTKRKPFKSTSIVKASIRAINLENSDEIDDPITRTRLKGNLPWDRYYGNYVYIKVGNSEKPDVQLDIPVRVVHVVDLDSYDKKEIEFKEDIVESLLGYYTRYYPWLHVEFVSTQDLPKPKLRYGQFLDLGRLSVDGSDWGQVQRIMNVVDSIINRLSRDNHDWKKMPRSRDFPFNGLELIKLWKLRTLDTLIENLENRKSKYEHHHDHTH